MPRPPVPPGAACPGTHGIPLHPVYPGLTASVQVVCSSCGGNTSCTGAGRSCCAAAAAGRLSARVVLSDEQRGIVVTYAESVDPGDDPGQGPAHGLLGQQRRALRPTACCACCNSLQSAHDWLRP